MKVYWRILHHGAGRYQIKFWLGYEEDGESKVDTFVNIGEEYLRKYVENTFNLKHFSLVRIVK